MKFFTSIVAVVLASATAAVAQCNIAGCTQLSCQAYCKSSGLDTSSYACTWLSDKGCSECVCGVNGLPPPLGNAPSQDPTTDPGFPFRA
ncbi:hypothetical protein B0J12DRAFT_736550 [Macrophomina phaseolina]|uniref:Uncharacterized protein n=1 Tax=Macrophomina phaseolina TaxID=35725 RepID=A0ABQ8GNV2_9PEZI|nr:hypothetical protein B0J12DRAFT_736550 [Macrophomina phaseolina]